jgi:hypothetical protein
MNNLKQFEAFDGLETIQASKLGLTIGFMPSDAISVIKKNHLAMDFIVYVTKKEYFENKGDWGRVKLWFAPVVENKIIIFQEESKSVWLYEEISNILRII